jgi:hypothetical protein
MNKFDRLLEKSIADYRAGTVTALTVERAAREAQAAHFAMLVGKLIARLRGSNRPAAVAIEPGRTAAGTAA